jgi:hypothetical protein
MNPYDGVTSDRSIAPWIARIADGQCELRFARALGPGTLVFTERPLVEDAVREILTARGAVVYARHYNDRWAWSLIEQCLRRGSLVHDILSADYATGLVANARAWERPGDDHALTSMLAWFPAVPRRRCANSMT